MEGHSGLFISKKTQIDNFAGQLRDEERASFIGIEEHSIYLQNGNLVCSLNLSRNLAKEVSLSIYLFGYRRGVSFGKIPKLHIKIKPFFYAVYDQDKRMVFNSTEIKIKRQGKKILVNIPLSLLGDPEMILTSSNTYLGDVILDWVSWRILKIR